jgi:hypothetical protein
MREEQVDPDLTDEAELAAWLVVLWALVPPIPNEVGRLGNEALRKIDKGVGKRGEFSGIETISPAEIEEIEALIQSGK